MPVALRVLGRLRLLLVVKFHFGLYTLPVQYFNADFGMPAL